MAFFHKSEINVSQRKGFQYHSLHCPCWLLRIFVLWQIWISMYFGAEELDPTMFEISLSLSYRQSWNSSPRDSNSWFCLFDIWRWKNSFMPAFLFLSVHGRIIFFFFFKCSFFKSPSREQFGMLWALWANQCFLTTGVHPAVTLHCTAFQPEQKNELYSQNMPMFPVLCLHQGWNISILC